MPKPRNGLTGLYPPVGQYLALNRFSPQAAGLFAAWPLMEPNSAKIHKEVRLGFHALVSSGVQLNAEPVRGVAPYFDGTGTGGGIQNTNMVFPGSTPITVMFWSRVMTADVANGHSAFSIGNGAGGTLNEVQAHLPWGDNTLYWDCGGATGNARISTSYASYLNKWTHVALVSAGNGGNYRAIYLDGVLATSAAASSGPTANQTGIYIGVWPNPGNAHKGYISDFRVYRIVVPAEIIAAAADFDTAYDLYLPIQRIFKAGAAAAHTRSFASIIG